MKTVSFLNRKGGVGKSVVSLNLANELQRLKYRILFIDLDPQSDSTKILDAQVVLTEPAMIQKADIFHIIKGTCKIGTAIRKINDNLHYIPGSHNLIHFTAKYSQNILADILKDKAVINAYDYVIIDHPPNLNEAALAGIIASDKVLIVTEPESFSIENLDKMVKDIRTIKDKFSLKVVVAGIIINRVDGRRSLVKRQILGLRQRYNNNVLTTIISNDTAIPTSIDEKKFVRDIKWRSKTVDQFSQVASEFVRRV